MSYAIVSRPRRSLGSAYAPTVPPPDSSPPTFNDAILEDSANRNLVPCPGTEGVFNRDPTSRKDCCGPATWMESVTRRVFGESTWRMYLERIVRDNVVTYVTGQAVDNAARDLPTLFPDAPIDLKYSPSLAQAADAATANFWDLFQQGRYVPNPTGAPTACRDSGYYKTFDDPGNPDKALEAAAYRRIFGRDPSDAEKQDLMNRAWAIFELLSRKTGSGWMDQPIHSDAEWNGFWTYTTAGLVAPTTWTKGFLDVFYPAWKRMSLVQAIRPKLAAASKTVKSGGVSIVGRLSPSVMSVTPKKSSTQPTGTPSATGPLATSVPSQLSAKVVVSAAVVAVAAIGLVGYLVVR